MPTEQQHDDDQTVDAAAVIGAAAGSSSPGFGIPRQSRKTRFLPGALLSDRFIIIRFLGSGGMGEVYEAQDRLLQDSSVALKTISVDLASSPEAQDRFEREVLLARQVNHPNVCPIYHIDYHEDSQGVCCFLSMKLLRGETLAARLERQPKLTIEESLIIIRNIAAALHAAHQAQIIHRDIKPSNIMLDGAGREIKATVMDFGLARTYDSDLTHTGSAEVMGTPGYIAPELLRGQPASAASDLYAFGVVLHRMFGGEKQRRDDTPFKLAPAVRSSGVPPFIPALITQCLSDDPDKRYQAFRQSLAKLNLDSSPVSSPYQTKPFWTRRRWVVAAASAGCALGAGTVWEWDDITALFNPLPKKRFVALVNWPQTSERQFAPMVVGVIDALERELSRAEAFDRDLLVMPAPDITQSTVQLGKVSNSLGANLVLASSIVSHADGVQLSLKILDAGEHVLRNKAVVCAIEQLGALPEMAVRAAASLLGVSQYVKPGARLNPGTLSAEAYQHFEAAEALLLKANDQGVDGAIEQYKKAVELDSHYAIAYAKLAFAYGRLYKTRHEAAALDLAQANANTSVELDARLVAGHQALGLISFVRGKNEAAISAMEKALSLDPSDPSTLTYTAMVLTAMGKFKQSEQMFQRVLHTRPNHWVAYNELGNVLKAEGKYPEAFAAFDSARLANPQNTLVLSNLGEVALKLGRLKESRQSLEKSLALAPSGIGAADLAEELRAEGKYMQALSAALKAVDLDSKDDENWRELGDCYSALSGRNTQAEQAYSRAAEEATRQLQINNSEGPRWMLLALYQAKIGRLVAAKANARKAEALGAGDLDSQLTKGRVLELLGQRDDALKTLNSAHKNGATKFEIGFIPDLQSLRADARYLTIFHPK